MVVIPWARDSWGVEPGMLIGTFKVEKETQALITVNTAKGSLIFDKKTGIQVNTEGRFANRIDL